KAPGVLGSADLTPRERKLVGGAPVSAEDLGPALTELAGANDGGRGVASHEVRDGAFHGSPPGAGEAERLRSRCLPDAREALTDLAHHGRELGRAMMHERSVDGAPDPFRNMDRSGREQL